MPPLFSRDPGTAERDPALALRHLLHIKPLRECLRYPEALRGEQTREQQLAAWGEQGGEAACQRDEDGAEDVGDEQVDAARQLRLGAADAEARGESVVERVLARRLERLRIDVVGPDMCGT